MAVPLFSFDQPVTAASAKQDKLEVQIEGLFQGDAEEVGLFRDYLGCPPEHLRDSPEFSIYGKYFKRPENLEPPFYKDQGLRETALVLGGVKFPRPLASGHLKVKHHRAERWRLSLIASLNATRFVRHQELPARQALFAGELPSQPHQFCREIRSSSDGEFAYCGNDNWFPDNPNWRLFTSKLFWPRHLNRCLSLIDELIHDFERAASHAQGSLHPAWNFNVRHVETYWEFRTDDPLGLVFELQRMVKLFSRQRVRETFYDVPPDFEGKENSLCLSLRTRVGEWTKIYAKTNRRIRVEVTHLLSGTEGFEAPQGRHTFSTTTDIPLLIQSLAEIAASRVNQLFRHFRNHLYVPEEQKSLLLFIEQFMAACGNAEVTHELLKILSYKGSIVVGGDNRLGPIFRDPLRRLVRNEVLQTSNNRYSVNRKYQQALACLQQRGMGFILGTISGNDAGLRRRRSSSPPCRRAT